MLSAAWIYFILTFKAFWLVHAEIGRGLPEIVGCIGGCWVLILICKYVIPRSGPINTALSFLGQYSLIVLCMHIIELDLFKWKKLLALIPGSDMWPTAGYGAALFGLKLCWIVPMTILISKSERARRLFGMR